MRTYVLGLLLLLPIMVPFSASAAGIVTCDGTSVYGGKECTVCDIADTTQNVINKGIEVIVFLSSILFAYAGWLYITAGGDTNKATQGRKIFTNVAIGLILILSAWLIVDTIMKTLFNQGTQFGPWNKIC